MPIERERRATLRFAAGLALAALIGWGRGGPFAYVLPLLALLLLAPGTPPPAPRQALALLVITGLSCIWGLLLTPLLTYAPPAGVTVILAGVALSSFLAGMRPGLAVPLKLFIVGNTLIAVVAFHSQALAQFVAVQMGVDIVLAVAIAWVVAVLLPDRRDEPAPVPLPVPEPLAAPAAGWVGLRSALVMVLLIVPAILVAIALPAYNDYSLRAQSANAIAQAQALQPQVVEFLATHGRCPRNGDAGFGSPDAHAYAALASVDFGQFEGSGRCGLEAILSIPDSPVLDGKSIWLEYDSDADRWTCSSDVEDRHLPVGCRG